jgi:uncharacterized membrane protein YdbT with pleckstrin-like domain
MDAKYSENPAMWKNSPLGVILCVLLIPAFGLGLVLLLIWYARTKSTRLEVDGRDVVLEEGLLSKNRTELNTGSIRSVKISQSFFNRLFGVGKVEIFTAGDRPEIVAAGLPRPHTVRDLIKAQQAA